MTSMSNEGTLYPAISKTALTGVTFRRSACSGALALPEQDGQQGGKSGAGADNKPNQDSKPGQDSKSSS
jgi:hypothetical protein